MNIAELSMASLQRRGERIAAHYEGRDYRNTELRATAGRLANALVAAGVTPGDRVAVMLPNCPEVPIAYDAIPRIGAVCVPMLFLLAPAEIGHIARTAETKVLLTSVEFVGNVQQGLADVADPPLVLVVGSPEWDAFLDGHDDDAAIVDRGADDLAVVSFTGGTTGRPKGVMLTHGNLLAEVEMGAEVLTYTDDDVALGVLPMAHLFGLAGALSAHKFGYRSVLHRWFTPDGFLDAIGRHGITVTAMVPTMLTLVLNHPEFDRADFSTLRSVVVGASPLPDELANEWERRTGATILQGYGMTETSAGAVIDRPDRPRRPGSCGIPFPRTEVVVVADDGSRLPAGEIGELCIRGPQVTPGYWRNPEETAAALVDGWLHTGDMGHLDADGSVYVTERKKDLIIRAGFNVYPRDVEEVLYGHPAVAEAAVVGREDPKLGERVVACVVLRPGTAASAEELQAFCAERLAVYKTPQEIVFLDALPKSMIGKISKRDLRDLVAHTPSAGW